MTLDMTDILIQSSPFPPIEEVLSSKGKIIRLDPTTISVMGRPAKGVRLVHVNEPDFVVDTAKIETIE